MTGGHQPAHLLLQRVEERLEELERLPGKGAEAAAPSVRERDVIEAVDVCRRFGDKVALDHVSLGVGRGEIAALLGPNGAGKTTLLRILCGVLDPHAGTVRVLGTDTKNSPRALRQRVGLIPAGDRSFYLRISALENLVFFARLHGLSRRAAAKRAHEVLSDVGLRGVEKQRVGTYSHGMQKRLSVARALLVEPDVMLVDEATHDLDPDGAKQVRELIADLARRGAAILWTTQRLDEIRGFADSVTLLSEGRVRFAGTVPALMSHALPQRYLLRVSNGTASGKALESLLQAALDGKATIAPVADGGDDDFVLSLAEETALGDALRTLLDANVQIYACREEKSQIEDAFIRLTRGPSR